MPRELMHLMNAQSGDGSPGGGAVGTPAATPQAQGAASPPVDVTSIVAEVKNGIFAELRRAGVFKAGKDDGATAQSQTAAASTPSGLTADDVQKMLAARDALHGASADAKLNEKQRARMVRAYELEKPTDAAAWARDYLADLGLGGQQAQQGAANGATPIMTTRSTTSGGQPPASDGGAPGASREVDYDGKAWNMPQSEIDALIREKGHLGASRHIRDLVRRDLRGTRILLPGRPR